ncbi:MAG: hypothetical protein U0793_32110 [Gemmataceae bacterium]
MPGKEPPRPLRRPLIILVLFGAVVGYLESATVVYIRLLYQPIHQRLFPDSAPDDLFPAFSLEQWEREAPPAARSPVLEASRETGTVVAVALVAAVAFPTRRCWAAAFFLVAGVSGWSYYLGLKALIGWPHTPYDWDLIFMVPVPSAGPVWAALTGYAAMVAVAAWFFWGEAASRPLHAGFVGWASLLAGTVVTAAPFFWDSRRLMAGDYPGPFQAWLLAPGLILILLGMTFACRRGRRLGRAKSSDDSVSAAKGLGAV